MLWPRDVPAVADTAKGSTRAETAMTASAAPLREMLPVLRRGTERPGVLLGALFR